MSGSLWLVPRDNVPFVKAMQELISDTIPSDFPRASKKYTFVPHVTLASGIDVDKIRGGDDKDDNKADVVVQKWLDGINLPVFKKELDEVVVELDHIEAGNELFRSLVIAVTKDPNLVKLAAACKAAAGGTSSSSSTTAKSEAEDEEKKAQNWAKADYAPHMSLMYSDLAADEVQKKVGLVEMQIGWTLGSLFDCCGGTFTMGGAIVLVDTGAPVEEWKPIARREFPFAAWRMSRNLI